MTDTANDTRKVAFLVAGEGIERVELTEPWQAVADAGFQPVLVSPEAGEVQLFDHLDKSDKQAVDVTVSDALRMDEGAVAFVRDFMTSGKPVAAICHAPWTLVEADVVRGKSLTSWPSLRTDIVNAGGEWTDEKVVVDGNLITSRNPDDIPAFVSALLEALQHGDAANV